MALGNGIPTLVNMPTYTGVLTRNLNIENTNFEKKIIKNEDFSNYFFLSKNDFYKKQFLLFSNLLNRFEAIAFYKNLFG